jgi:hypothetical protein
MITGTLSKFLFGDIMPYWWAFVVIVETAVEIAGLITYYFL